MQEYTKLKIRSVTTPNSVVYFDLEDITKVLTIDGLFKDFDNFMRVNNKQVFTASLESDPTNKMRQMVLATDYQEFIKIYGN